MSEKIESDPPPNDAPPTPQDIPPQEDTTQRLHSDVPEQEKNDSAKLEKDRIRNENQELLPSLKIVNENTGDKQSPHKQLFIENLNQMPHPGSVTTETAGAGKGGITPRPADLGLYTEAVGEGGITPRPADLGLYTEAVGEGGITPRPADLGLFTEAVGEGGITPRPADLGLFTEASNVQRVESPDQPLKKPTEGAESEQQHKKSSEQVWEERRMPIKLSDTARRQEMACDAKAIAEMVKDKDAKGINKLLEGRTEAEKIEIRRAYKQETGFDFKDDTKKYFSGLEQDKLLHTMNRKDNDPIGLSADRIAEAFKESQTSPLTRERSQQMIARDILEHVSQFSKEDLQKLDERLKTTVPGGIPGGLDEVQKSLPPTEKKLFEIMRQGYPPSDKNVQEMAKITMENKNLQLFGMVMAKAPESARQRFLDNGGREAIEKAFFTPKSSPKASGSNRQDIDMALDYAKYGKLRTATEVRYATNDKGVENAIDSMPEQERKLFADGKRLSVAKAEETKGMSKEERILYESGQKLSQGKDVEGLSDTQKQQAREFYQGKKEYFDKAKEFYQQIHGELKKAGERNILGSSRESTVSAWEQRVSRQDSKTEQSSQQRTQDFSSRIKEDFRKGDRLQAIRDVQQELKQDPELAERLTHPKTAQDREASFYLRQMTDPAGGTIGFDRYVKPVLEGKELPIDKRLELANNQQKYQELIDASDGERKQLLQPNDKTLANFFRGGEADVARNVLEQKQEFAEDKLRAGLLSGDSKKVMEILRGLDAEGLQQAKTNYSSKYQNTSETGSLEADLRKNLSGKDLREAEHILARQLPATMRADQASQEYQKTCSGVMESFTRLFTGSGPAYDNAQAQLGAKLAQYYEKASPERREQLRQLSETIDQQLKTGTLHRESKEEVAKVMSDVLLTMAVPGAGSLARITAAAVSAAVINPLLNKAVMGNDYERKEALGQAVEAALAIGSGAWLGKTGKLSREAEAMVKKAEDTAQRMAEVASVNAAKTTFKEMEKLGVKLPSETQQKQLEEQLTKAVQHATRVGREPSSETIKKIVGEVLGKDADPKVAEILSKNLSRNSEAVAQSGFRASEGKAESIAMQDASHSTDVAPSTGPYKVANPSEDMKRTLANEQLSAQHLPAGLHSPLDNDKVAEDFVRSLRSRMQQHPNWQNDLNPIASQIPQCQQDYKAAQQAITQQLHRNGQMQEYRQFAKNKPELTPNQRPAGISDHDWEKFVETKTKLMNLNQQIRKRTDEIEASINKFGAELDPPIPPCQVELVDKASLGAKGKYTPGTGTVRLDKEKILAGGKEAEEYLKTVFHERVHSEQDYKVIRQLADELNIGKEASKIDMDKLLQEYNQRTGSSIKPTNDDFREFAESCLRMRDGQPLSPAESARAVQLADSFKARTNWKQDYQQVKDDASKLVSSMNNAHNFEHTLDISKLEDFAAHLAANPDYCNRVFGAKSQQVKQAIDNYLTDTFDATLKQTMMKELETALEQQNNKLSQLHKSYMQHHEWEAHRSGSRAESWIQFEQTLDSLGSHMKK